MSKKSNRPIGVLVEGGPATFPLAKPITGKSVILEPLSTSHAEGLFPRVGTEKNKWLWDYLLTEPFLTLPEYTEYIAQCLELSGMRFFAIRGVKTGNLLGTISYLNTDLTNRKIEIGNVLFSEDMQGSTMSTETHYLLMKHAFDLGYRRLEWKCNSLNEPSKNAAIRLGYKYEGTFRKHLIIKGRNRDTSWFSITDEEWPKLERGFQGWLDESNFDSDGIQRKKLAEYFSQ